MGAGAHALRPRRAAARLCLGLLILGALACGDDSAAPQQQQAPATVMPEGTKDICEYWRRADGSCDQAALIADYEDCLRTMGVPERERLRVATTSKRLVWKGADRMTNLCLELRKWVITETGRRKFLHRLNPNWSPK